MKLFERLFDPYEPADGPPPGRLWPFMKWLVAGAGPSIWGLLAATVALGVSEAAIAFAVGHIVDRTAAEDPATVLAEDWPFLLAALAFFLAIRPALMAATSGFISRSLYPGLYHLGVWRLHGHTLGQSMDFFEQDFAGRIAQKQTQTAMAITDVVVETLNAVSYGIAALIAAAVVLTSADWRLGAILAVWFAGYFLLVRYFLPRIRAKSKARAEARAGLSGQIVDTLSHMETVKLYAHSGREEAEARRALARFRAAALDYGRVTWAFRASLAVVASVLPVLLVGGAMWLWVEALAGPGAIAMAGMLSTRLAHMSGWISFTAMGIFTNLGVVEDGMRTLSPAHAITDAPDAIAPARARGAIAFEGVRFHYGREDRAGGLDGLDLRVAPGERVGLVGRSGAGKSTALSLLLRLHEVEAGRITLDGRDIRGLTQDGLRRQIATVTQDPAIFNRSALDNLRYGRPDATVEEVAEAARLASAEGFLHSLRDRRGREGMDAHLGEDGVTLSGGQRQRIALARAILKDAPILLLDEATSALDSEVEAEIQDTLASLMEGKTVIAIAHRLSTIQSMDRIVVMEAGRIIEEGPHDSLLAAGSLYARLWAHQSGGFLAPETRSAAE